MSLSARKCDINSIGGDAALQLLEPVEDDDDLLAAGILELDHEEALTVGGDVVVGSLAEVVALVQILEKRLGLIEGRRASSASRRRPRATSRSCSLALGQLLQPSEVLLRGAEPGHGH